MRLARVFRVLGSLYGAAFDERFSRALRTDLARHGLGRPDPDVAEMRDFRRHA